LKRFLNILLFEEEEEEIEEEEEEDVITKIFVYRHCLCY